MKKAIMQSSFTLNFSKEIKMTALNTAANRKLRVAKQARMLAAHAQKKEDMRLLGVGVPRGFARNERRIPLQMQKHGETAMFARGI
jgi:hypothetical protein